MASNRTTLLASTAQHKQRCYHNKACSHAGSALVVHDAAPIAVGPRRRDHRYTHPPTPPRCTPSVDKAAVSATC
ncbi:hypothetical protein EYF80_048575 [Liparis tanakae]|uniref:Uncharacterized protein n=1 Tax=Liparis tanakae TaxID=230148 RepID=A0A4Z2FJ84_9TELE|nr:hypothetical protein EYF80_048575 [Liparis tanakae]